MKSETVNFIICGTGDHLEKLKTDAANLPNVKFPVLLLYVSNEF